mmetsp:Transcript_5158/g.15108  ORF Transcript_5158/g.15108 Transcript_5158/m.15108 type:complete len:202 (-) Transcript_5158:312-917(-)
MGGVPAQDLVLTADGEALGERVVCVELAEVHGGAPVLDGVDHLQLAQYGLALLLDTAAQELRLESDLAQRVQSQGQELASRRVQHGAVEVVDSVMEICVCVALRPSREETLALARAHEGYVLHQVGEALLVVSLLTGAHVHLQMRLEAAGRRGVGQDRVPQAVAQLPAHHPRVLHERGLEVEARLRGRRGGGGVPAHGKTT